MEKRKFVNKNHNETQKDRQKLDTANRKEKRMIHWIIIFYRSSKEKKGKRNNKHRFTLLYLQIEQSKKESAWRERERD